MSTEKSGRLQQDIPRHVDLIDWETWTPTENAVLCFLHDDHKILMIHKKTGLGSGKINGPGGRIESGETPEQAAVRETREETGITPSVLEQKADLAFIFTDGYSLFVSIFLAHGWTGTMTETREAKPFWCPIEAIPYEKMWEDDPLWLPHVLKGKYVSGRFIFEEDKMLSHTLSISHSGRG